MSSARDDDANRSYYDEFSARYDARRGGNDPGGYHDLIDDLELEFLERYGQGRDVLEVGCGTGLLLERMARFARSAKGVDLSPGMLEKAKQRGLDAVLGSATSLPFPDASFDVTCAFKVLAHVPDIALAIREMARVTRSGGTLLIEVYNPFSLRALAKRLAPPGRISDGKTEDAVYTRFDAPWTVPSFFPPGVTEVASRGVRIVTPAAAALQIPLLGGLLKSAEHAFADSPLRYFGGFYIVAARKA